MDSVYNIIQMPENFGETSLFVIIISQCIIGIAAIIGSTVAIFGLNAWRKELRGKNEYEIARKVLNSIYKVREGISVVRHPMITSTEAVVALKEKDKQVKEPFGEFSNEGTYAVYEKRWKYISDAMVDLRANVFEAEVLWGNIINEKISKLLECVNILKINLDEHLDLKFRDYDDYPDKGRIKKIRKIVCAYDGYGSEEKSEFGIKLNRAIKELEIYLRPFLNKFQ